MKKQNSSVRKFFPLVLLFLSLFAYGKVIYNSDSGTTISKEKVEVIMQNHSFTPDPIVVPLNSTVTWINKDDAPHLISSDGDLFNSDTIAIGKSWSNTFTIAGTFKYHCKDHFEMAGSVIVK